MSRNTFSVEERTTPERTGGLDFIFGEDEVGELEGMK